MKSENHVHIHGGTVGAVGVGDGVSVVGHVSTDAPRWPANQEQHRLTIRDAQAALLRNQDDIDGLLFDALNQFLRLARDIQVEQRNQAQVQAQMKETLDEVWAQRAARGLKPQVLAKSLEFTEALIKNPVMAEVVKKLVGA